MFRKVSSKTLGIIFGILLVIAVIFVYYDSSREERTFTKDIVNIDTTEVTAISIYPKATNHKEVRLFKEGKYWQVKIDNNRSVPAQESKIKNLLNQLSSIEASSVAAQDESRWSEFKVDTSGTRVKVFESDENTLDITIGKFTFQQPRTMNSYVRVKGDENVYQVSGFLEFTFNQKPDFFRDNRIVNDEHTNWTRLSYSYPADSSFVLSKDTTGNWIINNNKTDSSKTIDFLRTLSHLTGSKFIDNPDQSLLNKADYTLNIQSSVKGNITISAFVDENSFIIQSSQNPDAYFDGNENDLKNKIFAGREYFHK